MITNSDDLPTVKCTISGISNVLRLENVDTMDSLSKHGNLEGDEDSGDVNDTLRRASFSEQKNGTVLMEAATDGADMPAASEGGSEGGRDVNETLRRASFSEQKNGTVLMEAAKDGADMPAASEGGSGGGNQTIIDILQPAAVESPEGKQSTTVYGHSFEHGRLKEFYANFRSSVSTTIARPADSHQDTDNGSDCRICQMSVATDVVIPLGCSCKKDLGRAHKVCAETWFKFKGNRQCEICGKIAKNVRISEVAPNPLRLQSCSTFRPNGTTSVTVPDPLDEDFSFGPYDCAILVGILVIGVLALLARLS